MKKIFSSILLLSAVTFGARAALVFNEAFTYGNGPLTAVAPAGTWVSFGGPAGQLDVAAGRAHLTQAETQDVGRGIGGGVGLGGTTFFGFDLSASTAPAAGVAVNYFAYLGNATTSVQLAKVFVVPGSGAGTYRVAVANGQNTPSAVFPLDLAIGTIHRVVVRYVSPVTGGPSTPQ